VLQEGHHRKFPQLTRITVPVVDLEDRKVRCFVRDKPKSQTCREKQDIKKQESIDFSHQTICQSLYLINETMSIVMEYCSLSARTWFEQSLTIHFFINKENNPVFQPSCGLSTENHQIGIHTTDTKQENSNWTN